MSQKSELMRIAIEKSEEADKALAERRTALLNVKLADVSDVFLKNNRLCDKITELSDTDFENILSAVIRSDEFNNLFDNKTEEIFNRKKIKADRRKATREANKAAQSNEEKKNCADDTKETCTDNSTVNNMTAVDTADNHFVEAHEETAVASESVTEYTAYAGEETLTVAERNAYADNTAAVSPTDAVNLSGPDILQRMTVPPSYSANGSNI